MTAGGVPTPQTINNLYQWAAPWFPNAIYVDQANGNDTSAAAAITSANPYVNSDLSIYPFQTISAANQLAVANGSTNPIVVLDGSFGINGINITNSASTNTVYTFCLCPNVVISNTVQTFFSLSNCVGCTMNIYGGANFQGGSLGSYLIGCGGCSNCTFNIQGNRTDNCALWVSRFGETNSHVNVNYFFNVIQETNAITVFHITGNNIAMRFKFNVSQLFQVGGELNDKTTPNSAGFTPYPPTNWVMEFNCPTNIFVYPGAPGYFLQYVPFYSTLIFDAGSQVNFDSSTADNPAATNWNFIFRDCLPVPPATTIWTNLTVTNCVFGLNPAYL